MEGLEGSVARKKSRDIYSHLFKETPSKSNTQPIQYVIVDEEDEDEDEDDEDLATNPYSTESKPLYIPPWRKGPMSMSMSSSFKDNRPQPGAGERGVRAGAVYHKSYDRPVPASETRKARDLSLVEELDTTDTVFHKPRSTCGSLGSSEVVNTMTEHQDPAKSREPNESGSQNKENECVPGYRSDGYTKPLSKHRSVSCTALPLSQKTPRRVPHSASATGLSSHKPTPLATRDAKTSRVMQEETPSQSQAHSDSECYDLPNLNRKTTRNVAIQTDTVKKKSCSEENTTSTVKIPVCCCNGNTTSSFMAQQCRRKVPLKNAAVQTIPEKKKKSSEDTTSPIGCDSPVTSLPVSGIVPNTVTVNHRSYTVLCLIGKGGSSKVEQVFDFENAKHLALKTVNLENQPPLAVASFRKEIEMLEKLQFSDKVIRLIDSEDREEEQKLFLLLECGETDLAVYLRRKLEDNSLHRMQRCVFWHDMLKAVLILHNQGIVHSDIKPANFMLVSGEIKLIDFGIARQLDADATSMELENCVGTLNYMPPEVLQGMGSKDINSKAGRKADVWSLGCILYYMAYGYTPFQAITTFIPKLSAITNPGHVIEMPDIGEPLLIQTLQMCLERDYKKRSSIEELLAHPYVR